MYKTIDLMKPFEMVNLAPMECLCSCVVTSLKMVNMNHHLFLLGCWDLYFETGMLISYRNPEDYQLLEYIYDAQLKPNLNGSKEHLVEILNHEGIAFFSCKASGLSYFPEKFLLYETSGFNHTIILYGYNQESNCFHILDPVVDYRGEMSIEELYRSSIEGNNLVYCTLQFSSETPNRPLSEIFVAATKRNLMIYTHGKMYGARAMELFEQEVMQAIQWDDAKREQWINQNNISIVSIIKMRNIVWQSVLSLELLSPDCRVEGEQRLNLLVQQWNTLNFLLLKFKRNSKDETLQKTIKDKVVEINSLELRFLEYMYQIGMDIG